MPKRRGQSGRRVLRPEYECVVGADWRSASDAGVILIGSGKISSANCRRRSMMARSRSRIRRRFDDAMLSVATGQHAVGIYLVNSVKLFRPKARRPSCSIARGTAVDCAGLGLSVPGREFWVKAQRVGKAFPNYVSWRLIDSIASGGDQCD